MKTIKSVHFNAQTKGQSVGCTKDSKSVRLATVLVIFEQTTNFNFVCTDL